MTKTNKGRVFVKRWGGDEDDKGLVDFYSNPRAWAVDARAQMTYHEFLWIFGIPLVSERVYEIRAKATARHNKAHVQPQGKKEQS